MGEARGQPTGRARGDSLSRSADLLAFLKR
jgi:hypothetical protein